MPDDQRDTRRAGGVWIAYLGFSHGTRSALGTLDHANQRPNTVAKIMIRLVSHQVAAGNRTGGLGREAARPARTSVEGGDVVSFSVFTWTERVDGCVDSPCNYLWI